LEANRQYQGAFLRNNKIKYSDLIAKPFEDYGRGPDSYDCYGLVIEISNRMGMGIPDFGSICSKHSIAISEKIDKFKWIFEKIDKPQAGDIVLIKRLFKKYPSHIGIMISLGSFMHTSEETDAHITELINPLYSNRIDSFYRYHERS
jgi:cell wall-associated NlpC family hydrolase